jgi:mRNA-degrading endonuclease toxin of MazEF toxin-antitoxin module
VVAQSELWPMESPNSKRRPVLIISRNEVIPVLNNVEASPISEISLAAVTMTGGCGM